MRRGYAIALRQSVFRPSAADNLDDPTLLVAGGGCVCLEGCVCVCGGVRLPRWETPDAADNLDDPMLLMHWELQLPG